MNLTAILMTVACLQVAATGKSQTVTLDLKNTPIQKVFTEVSRQTGISIVYNEAAFSGLSPVTIKVKNVSIRDVLDRCLKDQPFEYSFEGSLIVVKPKPFQPADVYHAPPPIDVRGRVVNGNGEPVAGASVIVKGTNEGTNTNADGYFELRNVNENSVLVISAVNIENYEVRVNGRSDLASIGVKMKITAQEEVIINAGYYTVKDKDRTGSISRITAKDIEKQPVNNVLAAMQANMPGVHITQTTGVPGGGFNVRVRGSNSIALNNEPFYVINGVPFSQNSLAGQRSFIVNLANPLQSINPADIESIEVLKDADATAIYGSRGANGVVLITTKKGKTGKAKTNISVNHGISRVAYKMNLMNTEQYLTMRREALSNDNLPVSSTDYDLNGTWDPNKNTDWQEELIGKAAPTTNVLVSLSGGTQNITYHTSGGYYRENTVFPGDNSYQRKSGNFSLQYLSDNKKFNLSLNANYSQVNSNLFTTDLTQFVLLAPNYPDLLGDNGSLNWANNTMIQNPIANTRQTYDAKSKTMTNDAVVSYAFLNNLKVQARFGFTNNDRKEVSIEPLSTFSPALNLGDNRRRSYFANNSINSWVTEGQVDWSKKIGNGKLNILIGTTFQNEVADFQEVSGAGYTSDALMRNIAAASTLTILNSYFYQYRYTAIFGRLNYNFQDKYLINATARRDGSSRFGLNRRFANFGAVGAAWIISNEKFMKDYLTFISSIKLRGSYGVTGNDRIPDYRYQELWSIPGFGNYQGTATLAPWQIANPNIEWEVNKKTEAAIELGFLENNIHLAINYYNNTSSNQLLSKQLTPSTGFFSIFDNLPATVKNTGWEFVVRTNNILNKKFRWSTSITLTLPKNTLTAYPNLVSSGHAATLALGYPLSIVKLGNSSVDPQTGLYVLEDYDRNGVIDAKDQYNIHFTGQKFYGGLENSISYKGITLDFLFQFVKQSGIGFLNGFNTPGSASLTQAATFNQSNELNNHWQNTNDVSIYQKYSTLFAARSAFNSARFRGGLAYEDASFIRLKNISLSYNMPVSFLRKLKLSNSKIYLQGQNIFTITSYKGLDPETQSLVSLPPLQVLTAGVQLTF